MKKIKMVRELVLRAMEKGEAKVKAYAARVENGSKFTLDHYCTSIIQLKLTPNGFEVVFVGGWSRSDVDAINTTLDCFGIADKVWCNRKTNNLIVLESELWENKGRD